MYPKPIQRLIDLFTKFPGIGMRQAARFAFFVLKQDASFRNELASALAGLEENVGFCGLCYRSIDLSPEGNRTCSICRSEKRDSATIAVVEKESDLHNLEKTSLYQGVYHVLGGVISPLDSDSAARLHLRELHERIKETLTRDKKCEVILATNSTTEGDMTAMYIERILQPLKKHYAGLAITRLGRGLSLGSELEYADEVTLRNALNNRK